MFQLNPVIDCTTAHRMYIHLSIPIEPITVALIIGLGQCDQLVYLKKNPHNKYKKVWHQSVCSLFKIYDQPYMIGGRFIHHLIK